MELWDIYDKERNKTNKVIRRGEAILKNEFCLVIHICIFNSDGEMLIQQRQPFKDGWPNMWDFTVGGSAVKGETSDMAARRELLEELGYEMDFSDERPFFTINFKEGFDDYYLIERNVDLSKLKLQQEEVRSVQWADKDKILEMIDEGIFIPYYIGLVDMIFEMRKHRGGRSKKAVRGNYS